MLLVFKTSTSIILCGSFPSFSLLLRWNSVYNFCVAVIGASAYSHTIGIVSVFYALRDIIIALARSTLLINIYVTMILINFFII